MNEFDLVKYWKGFDDALKGRYNGKDFKAERERIRALYEDVGTGERDLTIVDVIAIFEKDLPFIEDWTKPDGIDLEERMKSQGVAKKIAALRLDHYNLALLGEIVYCFRELSLTALVLQHVYPTHFAMCSHFLASQLYITGAENLPEFYRKYCMELREWAGHKWPTKGRLTVVETEYALWTWYRLAYHGENAKKRNRAGREFKNDGWIQDQRERQVAVSLNWGSRLDLARAYVKSDPTVAAIIAWREFEVKLGPLGIEKNREDGTRLSAKERIRLLSADQIPPGWNIETLTRTWCGGKIERNDVMHYDKNLESDEARRIVDVVDAFIRHNFPED